MNLQFAASPDSAVKLLNKKNMTLAKTNEITDLVEIKW